MPVAGGRTRRGAATSAAARRLSPAAACAPSPAGAGSRPAWAKSCGTRAGAGSRRPRTVAPAAPPPPPSRPAAAAAAPAASSSASRAPFHATSTPPSRSSGAAYSTSTRQRPDGAGRDRVVGLAAAPHRGRHAPELLRARGYGARVGHVARLDQPVHQCCLSSRRLDKVNLRLRQSHGQREPRKPCTCAYIRDPPRRRELRDLQPAQAVRHVNLERRLRLAHGRVRVRFGRQGLENALDLARRGRAEAVPGY